jgi:RimJ/RimL family protein N-acetyltransferase
MIRLRALENEDLKRISQWPPYPDDLRHMDYALRENGWICEFRPQSGAFLYAGEDAGDLIGFTILSKTAATAAEFRIALRADRIGLGLGKTLARLTLQEGFTRRGLSEIHLIVRKNHGRAIRLYQQLGFSYRGDCCRTIQGSEVALLQLAIGRQEFMNSQQIQRSRG